VPGVSAATAVISDYKVELPAGGVLHLQTPDECQFWEDALKRYKEEYVFAKMNDLVTLGQLLQQQVMLFRSQTLINGMEAELDGNGVPTGSYRRRELDPGEISNLQKAMNSISAEMRALEKQLGIDKATREQGGAHTVQSFVRELKRAAHVRAVHITKRTLEYERVINEVRVRLRLLYHGDDEDRKYHDVTPETVLDFLRSETDRLAEVDKIFNREKGKMFLGKL
jgi:hypothetical protein